MNTRDRVIHLFEKDRRLNDAVDAIRSRYGYDAVRLAGGKRHRHASMRRD